MKYLKSKKVFENLSYNIDDIQQTIEDILLPITDMGYKIVFTNIDTLEDGYNYKNYSISVKVLDYTDKPLKITNEVKDEFIRMNDYLGSLGLNSVELIYTKGTSSFHWDENRVSFSDFINIDNFPRMDHFKLRKLEFFIKP